MPIDRALAGGGGTPNFWDRIGTELTQHTAQDTVKITTGYTSLNNDLRLMADGNYWFGLGYDGFKFGYIAWSVSRPMSFTVWDTPHGGSLWTGSSQSMTFNIDGGLFVQAGGLTLYDNLSLYLNTAQTKSLKYNTATGNFTFNDDVMIGTNKNLWLDDTMTSGLAYNTFAGWTALWTTHPLFVTTEDGPSTNWLQIYAGKNTSTGSSAYINIYTKNASGVGNSGDISLWTGTASGGTSGNFVIKTGNAVNAGNIDIYTGTGSTTKGNINIYTQYGTDSELALQHFFKLDGRGYLKDYLILFDYPAVWEFVFQVDSNGLNIYSPGYNYFKMDVAGLTGYGDWRDGQYSQFGANVWIYGSYGLMFDTAADSWLRDSGTILELHDQNEIDLIAPSVWLMPDITGAGTYGLGISNTYVGLWNRWVVTGSEIAIDNNGVVTIKTDSNASNANGANINIHAGNGYAASNGNGGNVDIIYGQKDGSGTDGEFQVAHSGTGGGFWADLTSSGLWTSANQITLDETTGISLDAGVANLTFKDSFLSTAIPVSESGVTGLVGFIATSIVGALNEVVAYITAGVASGSFLSGDVVPKTVTVTNGIITNIV
jgi:hypothetical protein